MSLKANSHDHRDRLAHALGFSDYPANATVAPYLDYILKQRAGSETVEDYVELFVEVIEHFRMGTVTNGKPTGRPIQPLIDRFVSSGFRDVFADTVAGDSTRKEHVEDTVLCMIGTWTTMLSSFQHKSSSRKVVAAYRLFADATTSQGSKPTTPLSGQPLSGFATIAPYDESVFGLIKSSGLLPGGEWDQRMNSESHAASKLLSLLFNSPNSSNQTSLHNLLAHCNSNASTSQISPYALLEDLNVQESQSIKATRLNAFTLNVLSAVTILWTPNVSRHMLLSKSSGRYVIELFSLPCAFNAITASEVGIPIELTQEIEESYAVLFNAWPVAPLHRRLGSVIGLHHVCRCWSCSATRYRQRCITACRSGTSANGRRAKNVAPNSHRSDFDPTLERLMLGQSMSSWTTDDFPTLWPRITRLEHHLQTARPWSLSVLFRDRRDTMQFWTFLFATIVVLLTIVQVLLGIAQVVGSFN